ncbi:protein FAR1-RELATED SEQUENCE 5-like [Silene latifolia]|uniref:protein FAR1-RELATED SEQUENCE 5-like n=1 Tax=Silene latifolia TaxID=37657 RepID=UPI003D781071
MEVMEEPQPRRRLDFEHDEVIVKGDSSKTTPEIGMEFDTEEQFVKARFHSANGKVLDRLFVYSREGKRGQDKRDDAYKSHRPESRCLCPAKIKISCHQTGKYKIVKFNAEHNQNLATPSKAHLFRSHRKMTMEQAAEIDMIEGSGILPKAGFDFMAT